MKQTTTCNLFLHSHVSFSHGHQHAITHRKQRQNYSWWRKEYPVQMEALQCSIYFISDGGVWLQDVV